MVPHMTKYNKLSTQGRKPRHRSTKAEIDHERMAAKVITCLVSGKTIDETAMELDISITWVRRVRDELPKDFTEQFTQAKTNAIGALIEEGLRAQLLAMNKLVEVTNDPAWVSSHRATELAILFGVISDKFFRMFLAIERANERERVEQQLERRLNAA
jgi:hypothetical protein